MTDPTCWDCGHEAIECTVCGTENHCGCLGCMPQECADEAIRDAAGEEAWERMREERIR